MKYLWTEALKFECLVGSHTVGWSLSKFECLVGSHPVLLCCSYMPDISSCSNVFVDLCLISWQS